MLGFFTPTIDKVSYSPYICIIKNNKTMGNQTQSISRLTKTKQQEMFNGYYDILSNYFGGDEVESVINKLYHNDKMNTISFMKKCVNELNKLSQKGYWCNLTINGIIKK